MRADVIKIIEKEKIIAIIRGVEPEQAVKVAKALYEGGLKLVEVTFDQSHPESFQNTANAIRRIKQETSGKMCVGAGTVITAEQVNIAYDAGAEYIVSPDTDASVIRETVRKGMVSLPGAYTASEAKTAHNAGADFIKVFPCSSAQYIKALKAPLSHIKFLAVGGVNVNNAKEFIQAGACGVGVGGSLVNKEWIQNGEFDKITELAKKFIEILN